jgi:SAM-dependent methyltransferase
MSDNGEAETPGGPPRTDAEAAGVRVLGLGKPIAYGATGIEKRIDALRSVWRLEGEALLDVGCGNGAYTIELAGGFARTIGIDIESKRLGEFTHRAADLPSVAVEKMSAEALAFEDETFDVVTAIEVIEHIEELDLALSEIHRVLRPGGALCITCPNRFFPFETHVLRIGIHGRYVPGLPYAKPLHRRLATARNFTPGELGRLLARAGFRPGRMTFVYPPFDRWALGRRFIRPVTDRLERSRLRIFGVSIVAAFVKPESGTVVDDLRLRLLGHVHASSLLSAWYGSGRTVLTWPARSI